MSDTKRSEGGGTRRGARLESHAFAWGELTAEQRDAARKVRELVAEIAQLDSKREERPSRDFVRIDPDKRNQVVLIDGARGSGKTSVLLHLFREWNDRWIGSKDGPADAPWGAKERVDDGGVIPLRLVDLHPIPPGTHLLLHLVQAFEAAIPDDTDGHAGAEKDHRKDLWSEARSSKSRKSWNLLLRAFVNGWDDGFLKARRPNLDGEAYALELQEAERDLFDLMGSFRCFVDELCSEFQQHHRFPSVRRPLFVIGIDDADMNPQRVRELLQVLQLLVHPRVVFVLTGDRPLFLDVIRPHFEGAILQPLAHLGSAAMSEERINSHRKHLGEDFCEKVVPTSQSFAIEPLAIESRWEQLKGVMTAKRYGSGWALADIIGRDDAGLKELLPDRMRRVTALAELIERGDGDLFTVLRRLMPTDVDASGVRQTEEIVRLRRIRSQPLQMELRLTRSVPFSIEHWKFKPVAGGSLRESVPSSVQSGQPEGSLMADAVCRWLMLAGEVSSLLPGSTWGGEASDLSPFDLRVVEGTPLKSKSLAFPWPMPNGTNLLEMAVFLANWRRGRAGSAKPKKDRCVWFLACVIDAFDNSSGRSNDVWSQDLKGLVRRLTEMASGEAGRTLNVWRGENWARTYVGLMAAPESGLSASQANLFLTAFLESSGDRKQERIDVLVRSRRERVAWALKNDEKNAEAEAVDKLIGEIELASDGFDWHQKVEGRTPRTWIDELKEGLQLAGIGSSQRKWLNNVQLEPNSNLRPLIELLREFQGIPGSSEDAIDALWDESAKIAGLMSLTGIYARLGEPDMASPVQVDMLVKGRSNVGRITLTQAETIAHIPDTGPVLNWLTAIFQMLWDHYVNKSPFKRGEPPPWFSRYPEWAFANPEMSPTSSGGSPLRLGWPAMQWPSFACASRFSAYWTDVGQLLGRMKRYSDTSKCSVLAAEYIRASLKAVFPSKSQEGPFVASAQAARSVEDARAILHQLLLSVVTECTQTRRLYFAARVEEWFARLPLLAVPESGLDGRVAKAFADAWTDTSSHPNAKRFVGVHPQREINARDQYMTTLRRGRLVESGVQDTDADALIDRIDAAHAGGEWAWFFAESPVAAPLPPGRI